MLWKLFDFISFILLMLIRLVMVTVGICLILFSVALEIAQVYLYVHGRIPIMSGWGIIWDVIVFLIAAGVVAVPALIGYVTIEVAFGRAIVEYTGLHYPGNDQPPPC